MEPKYKLGDEVYVNYLKNSVKIQARYIHYDNKQFYYVARYWVDHNPKILILWEGEILLDKYPSTNIT